jgi:hypothetical protein
MAAVSANHIMYSLKVLVTRRNRRTRAVISLSVSGARQR